MKKLFFFLLAVVFTLQLQAQRYAVIDTRYILNKLPEYEDAQKKLDAFSTQWQKEIDEISKKFGVGGSNKKEQK